MKPRLIKNEKSGRLKIMHVFNRRAKRDYQFLEKYEAGIVLTGAEVKSIKQGRIKIDQSFIKIKDEEAFLVNAHISPYLPAGKQGHDALRTRKLLLKKKEILSLSLKIAHSGLTIVPLACYAKHGLIKLEIALAKGKRKYEKREAIKRRDLEREVERELRRK